MNRRAQQRQDLDNLAATYGIVRKRASWGIAIIAESNGRLRKRLLDSYTMLPLRGRVLGEGRWAYARRRIYEWWINLF